MKLYVLMSQLNDYDQPEVISAIFTEKPTLDKLLKLMQSVNFFDEKRANLLLKNKTIYDTMSNKAESWCYTSYYLTTVDTDVLI